MSLYSINLHVIFQDTNNLDCISTTNGQILLFSLISSNIEKKWVKPSVADGIQIRE